MSLAVLIPYRPDSVHRERIYETTSRLWAQVDVEVVYADDGLDGELFSYARAANRARARTSADVLLTYSVDALPLPAASLARLDALLSSGVQWSTVFTGQRRFTAVQTERLLTGVDPAEVGDPTGDVAMGREALLAVRAEVWDDLRGYDERFIGWGPEDFAFHHVLGTVYPDGCDEPQEGLFRTLWHPETLRWRTAELFELWNSYPRHLDAAAMRAWYLARP